MILVFVAVLVATVSAFPHTNAETRYYQRNTGGRPFSSWMADSALSRGQGNGLSPSTGASLVSYENGVFQRALLGLYNKTKNATYYEYIRSATNRVVAANGSIGGGYVFAQHQLDHLKLGESFIYLYEATRVPRYRIAAENYMIQLYTQPRTNESGFWHKQYYPNQQWLDGQYMGLPFYADYTATFDPQNTTAWNDIVLQLTLVHQHCCQASSGLLHHGYDESKSAVWADPVTGASPEVWGRALGWWSMALVDLLDYVPHSQTAGRKQILAYIQELAPALVKAADSVTGVWWLVMSQPGRTGNYFESSAAAMFVNFLLKASRLGYVDAAVYILVARKAYAYMVNNWVRDDVNGTISWLDTVSVGSLSGNGTFEYYISVPTQINDLKGLSPFILASLEIEAL